MGINRINSCLGKIKYGSHAKAERAMRLRQKVIGTPRGRNKPRSYLCPYCDSYHWGHAIDGVKRKVK